MGLKKLTRMVALAMFLIASASSVAKAQNDVINYGRVSVVMPQIRAEIRGNGYDSIEVSAMLGTEKLKIEQVRAFDKQSHSTCAYVLVDLSTSMRNSFALAKKNIISYIRQMGEQDKIVLVTFGKNEVNVPLRGGETKKQMIKVVKGLKCDQRGTLFYEALDRAYQLSHAQISDYDREYVLAFSDGIDVQKGSMTYREIKKKYQSHELPIYAYCAATSSKKGSDYFGELARLSGGNISLIHSKGEFAKFLKTINDVTLISMSAGSNAADGKNKQLSIQIGEKQAECMVPITRSLPGTPVPVAKATPKVEQKPAEEENTNGSLFPFLIVGIFIIGGGITIIILILKKRNREGEQERIVDEGAQDEKPKVMEYEQKKQPKIQHHIQMENVVRLKLKIRTGRNQEQNIEVDVASSLMVGRSDICDIYIDDSKLSRQHFAIENDSGRIFIMDLQSRNGTTLNGIRVNSRTELRNGDKIAAGLSDIIITGISR